LGKFMDMGAPLNTGKDCACAAEATKQHIYMSMARSVFMVFLAWAIV